MQKSVEHRRNSEEVSDVRYPSEKNTPRKVWAEVDAKYGKKAYKKAISDTAGKLMESGGKHSASVTADSVKRYMSDYHRIYDKFLNDAGDLNNAQKHAENRFKRRTKNELKNLKKAIENVQSLAGFKDKMPSLKNKQDIQTHFEVYMDALNERYFIKSVDQSGSGYMARAGEFKRKMKRRVTDKLEWMLKQEDVSADKFADYKREIAEQYELYANLDKNDAIISKDDLKKLKALANPSPKAIERFLRGEMGTLINRLEIMRLMEPGKWKKHTKKLGNAIINQSIADGNTIAFTKAISGNVKEVKSFKQAKMVFFDELFVHSEAGIMETYEFVSHFTNDVFGDTQHYRQNVEPKSLDFQVNKQLDYLLSGALTPDKETDFMLVTFMKGNSEVRQDMLANDKTRDTLFRAIGIATERYPDVFKDRYSNLPAKVENMSRSRNVEKPTYHDRAAQLQALIILGNQAKVIVGNYDQLPDNAGTDLVAEMNNTDVPKDSSLISTGLKFKAHGTKRARFQSALQRGGFNARNLGLLALEGYMALGVVSNLVKNVTNASGDDFIDKLFNGLENTVTDPMLIASTGLMAGAHMARRHPILLKYPWLSQHKKKALTTAITLDFIDARVTPNVRKRFTGSTAEWQILQRTPADQIRKLIKTANDEVKSGEYPRISTEMMVKAGVLDRSADMDLLHGMSHGAGSNRMRYLFYSKFFNKDEKPDVHYVKELTTGKGYIKKIN